MNVMLRLPPAVETGAAPRTAGRPRISARLHAGLDAARAAAACYVVLHHVATARGWAHGAGLALRFGQEAVLVFFLLSGFVIFANERARASRPGFPWRYYARRARRIYPPLVAALVVATLVSLDNGTFGADFRWDSLLGTLGSVQDVSVLKPGVIADPYLHDDPLWSLSYEVAFYLLFPFVLRGWLRRPGPTTHGVGAACCAAYAGYAALPNHWLLVASYFLVWWAGAMAAEAYGRGARNARAMWPVLAWLAVLCAVALAATAVVGSRGLGLFPVLMLRHFAVALLLVVVLFGRLGAALASLAARGGTAVAAVASVSYGLYVLHYPLLVSWDRARGPGGLLLAAVLLVPAAWLADRVLPRLLPRAPAG